MSPARPHVVPFAVVRRIAALVEGGEAKPAANRVAFVDRQAGAAERMRLCKSTVVAQRTELRARANSVGGQCGVGRPDQVVCGGDDVATIDRDRIDPSAMERSSSLEPPELLDISMLSNFTAIAPCAEFNSTPALIGALLNATVELYKYAYPEFTYIAPFPPVAVLPETVLWPNRNLCAPGVSE